MLTMPFTVAVYMVRSFLQKANSSSGTLLLRESNTAANVNSGGFPDVDEQLVGQLTGTLVSHQQQAASNSSRSDVAMYPLLWQSSQQCYD